jgi:hypothetical protein
MRYYDYYLKFDSKEQFEAIQIIAETITVVGNVYVPTGQMLTDEEGNEYPETTATEGYYVNVRSKQALSTELIQYVYIPEPDFPIRRWATKEYSDDTEELKIPKGDLMALLSVDSLANIIGWMRAEADNYALAFHEYFKAHERFKVKDPVFLQFITLLANLNHITEDEKSILFNL